MLPSTTSPLRWKQPALVAESLPKWKSKGRTKNKPQDCFCPLWVTWRVGAMTVDASLRGWVWWVQLSGVGTSTGARPFVSHTLTPSLPLYGWPGKIPRSVAWAELAICPVWLCLLWGKTYRDMDIVNGIPASHQAVLLLNSASSSFAPCSVRHLLLWLL